MPPPTWQGKAWLPIFERLQAARTLEDLCVACGLAPDPKFAAERPPPGPAIGWLGPPPACVAFPPTPALGSPLWCTRQQCGPFLVSLQGLSQLHLFFKRIVLLMFCLLCATSDPAAAQFVDFFLCFPVHQVSPKFRIFHTLVHSDDLQPVGSEAVVFFALFATYSTTRKYSI